MELVFERDRQAMQGPPGRAVLLEVPIQRLGIFYRGVEEDLMQAVDLEEVVSIESGLRGLAPASPAGVPVPLGGQRRG